MPTTEQIIEDAETAIKVSDGVARLKERIAELEAERDQARALCEDQSWNIFGLKHDIGVALEEYDAGEHAEAIGRLRELTKRE